MAVQEPGANIEGPVGDMPIMVVAVTTERTF